MQHVSILLVDTKEDAPQRVGIVRSTIDTGEPDGLIADQPGCPVDLMGVQTTEPGVGLGPQDKEAAGLMQAVETGEVEFDYLFRGSGRRGQQRIQPYGVLYGNRAFLVGRTDRGKEPRLWRLSNMRDTQITDEAFERDPAFDLRQYAGALIRHLPGAPSRCGASLRCGRGTGAKTFQFHPSQCITESSDGSLTVRFRAAGIDEICWHLVTWGESVTILEPPTLRQRLAQMCASLAAHHRRQSSL